MALLPKIALLTAVLLVARLSFLVVIDAADSSATSSPASSLDRSLTATAASSPVSSSSMPPSSVSSSVSPASSPDLLCPAKYATKHKETDKLIGDSSKVIPGSHSYPFSNKAKETVTFAMAGEKNSHVIVVSMPGFQLGQFDFGGTASNSTVYVSTDGGKNFTPVRCRSESRVRVRERREER